ADFLNQGDIAVTLSADYLEMFDPTPIGLVVVSNSCDLLWRTRMAYVSVAPLFKIDLWFEEVVAERKRKTDSGQLLHYEDVIQTVAEKFYALANYEDKRLFFFPPHVVLGGSAAFTSMEQITFLPISVYDEIL